MDGSWYSDGTRSVFPPNSGRSGAGEQQSRAPPLGWQEHTVGDEPEALTFTPLDSMSTWLTTDLRWGLCVLCSGKTLQHEVGGGQL